MDKFDVSFADSIAAECIRQFNKLGKTGKPRSEEWTLLAGVVKVDDNCESGNRKLEVVALGSGSKCIGAPQIPLNGNVLHDSHAEVVARRAFILYLFSQIEKVLDGLQDSIFEENKLKLCLKDGLSFHFYCSHTPCGDASIFDKEDKNIGDSDKSLSNPSKKLKLDAQIDSSSLSDIYRTGAKPVPGEPEDSKADGKEYHTTGVLRNKPGRGAPTLSHSCSDKIFKWSVLGVQGALIMLFVKYPIYYRTITIGHCPFSADSFQRAVVGRFESQLREILKNKTDIFCLSTPQILKSDVAFISAKSESKTLASSVSLIWSRSEAHHCKHEVSNEGKRSGSTKKTLFDKCLVSISRYKFLKTTFLLLATVKNKMLKLENAEEISSASVKSNNIESSIIPSNNCLSNVLSSISTLIQCSIKDPNFEKRMFSLSYKQLKMLSVEYQTMWLQLNSQVLPNWTKKPLSAQAFTLLT